MRLLITTSGNNSNFLLPKIHPLLSIPLSHIDLALNRNNKKRAILLPFFLASSLLASTFSVGGDLL